MLVAGFQRRGDADIPGAASAAFFTVPAGGMPGVAPVFAWPLDHFYLHVHVPPAGFEPATR